jgi:type I restriction enzyme M protein
MNIDEATRKFIDSLKQTCGSFGLGNDGNEYKIIIQVFLYKYFNDKFGYEAKRTSRFGERLRNAERWDLEYDKFTEDEMLDLFDYLPAGTPRLRPQHTISHLYNAQGQSDISTLFDATLIDIADLNADVFSVVTDSGSKLTIFEGVANLLSDTKKRDQFVRSLLRYIADPDANFEEIFEEKYDFFSTMFEHLIKDYNKDGGGKYAEYYTPRSIALIMARLLVGDATDLRNIECYDPSAGTGTLLMALAHTVGEDRCTMFSQDVSQKSSLMLRLNLILNNLPSSIQNVVQGNTLLNPGHKNADGTLKKFDFIVSNPPFKLDFPDIRDTIAKDTVRFWAGVPNSPKKVNPEKPAMKIFLCFIQHMINSLKEGVGRGAIVVPTGFITNKQSIEKKILKKIVDEKIVYGCISMPSNVFASTNTNVSVLFFDKSKKHDKVILIDASQLGEEYKDGNNQRTRLRQDEIDLIVNTFINSKEVDEFSAVVTYEDIKAKGYTLGAGQYFDIKIDHIDISEEEFNSSISTFMSNINSMQKESERLTEEMNELITKIGL